MRLEKLIKKINRGGVALISLSLGTAALTVIPDSVQAITITPTSNGNTLANTILGSGITITPGSVNYNGATGASGTFTNGLSSGIGIDQGIILTSGSAVDAVGPNDSDSTTTSSGLGGDTDLDNLIPGFNTLDASILEFEFESAGGGIFFDYVFASEEYNEFVNTSFNDVFGFFLDGVNIALIPATTNPVSIDNVNLGNNSSFYNNNDPSDTSTPFNIEYDGFTTVFQAKALGLSAGKHKIKLAIADAGDQSLDSAVFIQAGSFSDNPDPEKTPEASTSLSLLALAGFGLTSIAKKKKIQA